MNYTRVLWQDDKTLLSATNLNQMDEGIYNLATELNSVTIGGRINGALISDGTIRGSALVIGSIPSDKIGAGAITDSKLANNSVTTDKILMASITDTKIANGAVLTSKLADYSVTNIKLSSNSVSSDKIQNRSVTPQKIGSENIPYGRYLMSDGSGSATWNTLVIPENFITSISIDGKTAVEAINGVATIQSVQSDFNETDSTQPSFIKNKPTSFPEISSRPDSTKYLSVVPDSGSLFHYEWSDVNSSELPSCDVSDVGKVLAVVNSGGTISWAKSNKVSHLDIGNFRLQDDGNGLVFSLINS